MIDDQVVFDQEARARRRGLTLPLYDSGAQGPSDHTVRMAAGGRIEDRVLVPRFPAKDGLEKNGIILFLHTGPLHQWPAYAPLLRHASNHAAD